MIFKYKKFFISLVIFISILLCGGVFLNFSPTIILKVYKQLYVVYIRITKSKFESRFNTDQLITAIKHASKQTWVLEQINKDLKPFQQGISYAAVDQWFRRLQHESRNKLVKFTILNSKISVDAPQTLLSSRSYKTVFSIIDLLAKHNLIPDCKFIIALNDYLSYIPQDIAEPVAIFTFAKDITVPIEQHTILIPDWMNVRYWDVLRGRIFLANKIYPWQKKKNLIHWRGGCADEMKHRAKLVNLNNKFKFLDVGMTEGSNKVPRMDPEFSVQFKYQIALDGSRCTWERIVWQMYSNSVLIKPDSPHKQWFYLGLKPYYNYIPVEDIDEDKIIQLYNWLQNNDTKVQAVVGNANTFAKDNFKTQDFFAYYAVLLQEYAKLMIKK